MGIGSSIKKAVKKVTGGIKKAFGAVKKVGSFVADNLRKVGRELKRFSGTTFGKVVIAAALIYAGGAAFAAMNSGGTMTFAQALANPGAVGGQLSSAVGMGGGNAGAAGGTAGGASSGAAAGGAAVGTTTGTGAVGGAVKTAAAVGEAGAATGTGAVAGSAGGGLLTNPMVQYGGAMAVGQAVSGSMAAKAEKEMLEDEEKRRLQRIKDNVVPDVDLSQLNGLQFNPMTGQQGGPSTEQFLPENLRMNDNLQARYTQQGLLNQGVS